MTVGRRYALVILSAAFLLPSTLGHAQITRGILQTGDNRSGTPHSRLTTRAGTAHTARRTSVSSQPQNTAPKQNTAPNTSRSFAPATSPDRWFSNSDSPNSRATDFRSGMFSVVDPPDESADRRRYARDGELKLSVTDDQANVGSESAAHTKRPRLVSENAISNTTSNASSVHRQPLATAPADVTSGSLSNQVRWMAAITVLGIVPSVLIVTTCFVRFMIVMGLLRQALGIQTVLSNQILASLCLFLTLLVMSPVWQETWQDGIQPWILKTESGSASAIPEDFERAILPVRRFMGEQIEAVGNSDAVWLLLDFQQQRAGRSQHVAAELPASYDEIPLSVLLPAYMLSELKTAFIIGFQLFLPFVVIDMVVSAVLVSMGMMMLPPTTVSLPFKLLLFVLADGWFLTVGMLLASL